MTAVEILADKLQLAREIYGNDFDVIIQQAKEVEKQQIIDAIIWFDDTDRKPNQIQIEIYLFGLNKL